MYQADIVSGTSASTFSPYNNLTREPLAVMRYKAIMYIEQESRKVILPQISTLEGYTDERLISPWAVEAVTVLVVNNIMSGTSPATLSPQSATTIEQALVLALRVGGNLK